jgi:hypothetical protein
LSSGCGTAQQQWCELQFRNRHNRRAKCCLAESRVAESKSGIPPASLCSGLFCPDRQRKTSEQTPTSFPGFVPPTRTCLGPQRLWNKRHVWTTNSEKFRRHSTWDVFHRDRWGWSEWHPGIDRYGISDSSVIDLVHPISGTCSCRPFLWEISDFFLREDVT